MQVDGWAVFPQTRPSSIHDDEKFFRLDVMQLFQNSLSWWLGRAPQHPLSRPSSFRGVEKSFRLDVMQTINSVQMNGWSCSPKHGPAQFTVLSQLFVRMAWNLSKTFETFGWVVLPQARSISIHNVEKLFRPSVMQPFKSIQADGWAALPNIPCHGPAFFTALNTVFVLMICRLSTAFKWTAGRAPPNTA